MKRVCDKERRAHAFEAMRNSFRAYRGRITGEWHDRQSNAVYLWVLFKLKPNDADCYEPLATVMVNILWDGSVFIYPSETAGMTLAGLPQTGKWEDTVAMLEKLEASA